jgi:hypothetical protein
MCVCPWLVDRTRSAFQIPITIFPSALLVAQRFERVEGGSFARRAVAIDSGRMLVTVREVDRQTGAVTRIGPVFPMNT